MSRSSASSPVGLAFLVAASVAALGACSSAPKPAPKVEDAAKARATDAPSAAAKKLDVASPTTGSIHIDDKITKLCGDLPETHFAFDSADVGPSAGSLLDPLARCFLTGPAKGKGLRLVGHADPRGETEYNFALGMKRASSVAKYLVGKGMDKGHVEPTSKGELEATGTDEAGWARDRKVEIYLSE
jgi:peptidoglycan-associated lipoprotein